MSINTVTLPILTDDIDDYRTWTFAGDEGSTITVSASETHLTIERERSSYEGHRSSVLVFVHHTDADEFPVGTHDNTDRNGPTRVLVDPATDLRDAWSDALADELGSLLRAHFVTAQPEPLSN